MLNELLSLPGIHAVLKKREPSMLELFLAIVAAAITVDIKPW